MVYFYLSTECVWVPFLLLFLLYYKCHTYYIDIVVYKTYICMICVEVCGPWIFYFINKKASDMYPLNKIYTQLISVDYKDSSIQRTHLNFKTFS